MGILESAKQRFDELTGKAERQREQDATRKAEAEATRAKAEQAKHAEIETARSQAAERSTQERLEKGPPAARMAAQAIPGQEDRLRQARQQQPEPAQPVKTPEIPPQEAERMKLQTAGLQRGPSPGGQVYVNRLAHNAVLNRQQQHSQLAEPQREPTMIEKMQQRQKAEGQDRSTPAPKPGLEQRIKTLDQELGRP